MGKVILIGAGPGDPGLLTVKGRSYIEKASCIVYDRLAAPELLELAPGSCEKIFVGKANHHHTMRQEKINELLVELAGRHETVVRLKGGDPYIFGRGGEEALYLLEHGIQVEVVSGVTSVAAVLASAGIPITHRGLSKGFQVVTAHSRKDEPAEIDYGKLTDPTITYVFLMGLSHVREIAEGLLKEGRDPATPAAVISNGTTPRQKTICAPLVQLADTVERANPESPAIIVVGETVALSKYLNFYENRPLFGMRCLVPVIESEETPRLPALLMEQGARVTAVPIGRIERIPAGSKAVFSEELQADWILFTSKNGVKAFMKNLSEIGLDARAIRGKIGVVGEETKKCLKEYFLQADLVPEKQTGEGLAAALSDLLSQEGNAEPAKVVLYGAEEISGEIKTLLESVCNFAHVPVYRNAEVNGEGTVLEEAAYDCALLTSASGARRLDRVLKRRGSMLPPVCFSIGPSTTRALEELGAKEIREAGVSALSVLISDVQEWYGSR